MGFCLFLVVVAETPPPPYSAANPATMLMDRRGQDGGGCGYRGLKASGVDEAEHEEEEGK